MATTKGFTAAGATFGIDVTNGNSYVTIGQIKTLQPTQPKWKFEDITCLSSPTQGSGVIMEQMPTILDPGSYTGTAIYLPSDAGLIALRASCNAGNLAAFSLTLPPDKVGGQSSTGDNWKFSGFVSDLVEPDTYDSSKAVTYKFTVLRNTASAYTQGS
jgi:hypothetical protein